MAPPCGVHRGWDWNHWELVAKPTITHSRDQHPREGWVPQEKLRPAQPAVPTPGSGLPGIKMTLGVSRWLGNLAQINFPQLIQLHELPPQGHAR